MTPLKQRQDALQKANEIRFAHAKAKRRLASVDSQTARNLAAGIILLPPQHLETMTVYCLLKSCHRLGPKLACKFLVGAHVSDHTTLKDLTERQRTVLARRLKAYGKDHR